MWQPSEQLRRILQEMGATQVQRNQESVTHLKRAHDDLSRLWKATCIAEAGETLPSNLAHQEPIRFSIWNRHTRLCSALDTFFENGSPNTFQPIYMVSVGAYRFIGARTKHPETPTHTVYVFTLTSAVANKGLLRCRRL